jgi:cyclase
MTPRLEHLGEHVYAYIQPPGGWCVNNAGVIAGTMLIDTAATETRALRLRTAAETLDAGPIRTIVNTHFHGDHVFGNGLMGDGVTIVAHELTRHDIAATGLGLTRLWPAVVWGRVAPTLPTVTFTDRLTLRERGLTVELIHMGAAHTTGDVVAWLPDERILFAGDVAFSGGTPYVLMGSVAGSLRAIDRLRALEPRVVVCGHGPVTGPDVFDATEAYLSWLWRLAARGLALDQDPLSTALDADLGAFGALQDSERLLGNLHRAYAEHEGVAPGEPLDVRAVHRDMVAYHGRPLISLA